MTELDALMRAHNFNDTELRANRAGTLSPRQRRAALWGAVGWLVGALLVIAVGLGLLLAQPGWWPGAVLALLIALFSGGTARALLLDAVASAPIRTAEGPVVVHTQALRRSLIIFYRIGGEEFELSNTMIHRQAHTTLRDHRRYRVYALARSRVVVSLEPIP